MSCELLAFRCTLQWDKQRSEPVSLSLSLSPWLVFCCFLLQSLLPLSLVGQSVSSHDGELKADEWNSWNNRQKGPGHPDQIVICVCVCVCVWFLLCLCYLYLCVLVCVSILAVHICVCSNLCFVLTGCFLSDINQDILHGFPESYERIWFWLLVYGLPSWVFSVYIDCI